MGSSTHQKDRRGPAHRNGQKVGEHAAKGGCTGYRRTMHNPYRPTIHTRRYDLRQATHRVSMLQGCYPTRFIPPKSPTVQDHPQGGKVVSQETSIPSQQHPTHQRDQARLPGTDRPPSKASALGASLHESSPQFPQPKRTHARQI